MKLLIVSATKLEIHPLTKKISLIQEENNFLSHYKYNSSEIDILVTGIGMTATAFHLGRQLSSPYDIAINVGICGSFDSTIQMGEVIEVIEENFCESGAENNDLFQTLFDLGLVNHNDPPFTSGRLLNNTKSASPVISGLRKVKGTTANTIHGKTETIRMIKDLFHPEVESMEGAAFFYSCLLAAVPFHQVRSVSNFVGERDKSKWKMNSAIENLNSTLFTFLQEVTY
jgi:futalosine hydrolase